MGWARQGLDQVRADAAVAGLTGSGTVIEEPVATPAPWSGKLGAIESCEDRVVVVVAVVELAVWWFRTSVTGVSRHGGLMSHDIRD